MDNVKEPSMSHPAYYVIRLRSNYFNLYDGNAQKVSLLQYFENLGENETGSVSLYYKSKDGYMPIRICAIRKTKEAEMDGISRIKKSNIKKMRGKVSKIQSAYNRYVIVATSLSSEVTASRILELYRMRWQIELVFKRLKSIFNYDEMPSKNLRKRLKHGFTASF